MKHCPECDSEVVQPKCPKCGRRVMDRKWSDLTSDEKEVLNHFVEFARQTSSHGDPVMQAKARENLADMAKMHNLNQRQWSYETLSKTGCLSFVAFIGATGIMALVVIFNL